MVFKKLAKRLVCDPAANYFEPLLAHFNQLMKVYEAKEDENVIF